MKPKHLWPAIGLGLVLPVIVASVMPNPPSPAEFKGIDKLEDFAAYAFMMLWFAQIYTRNRVRYEQPAGIVATCENRESRRAFFRTCSTYALPRPTPRLWMVKPLPRSLPAT
jgi:hypothetical protein